MGIVISMQSKRRAHLLERIYPRQMTREQAIEECRKLEAQLMELEDGLCQLADAVWPPEEHGERPDEPDAGYSVAELVSGIQILHELSNRLTAEVERAEVRGLMRERAAVVAYLERLAETANEHIGEALEDAANDLRCGEHGE